MKLKINIFGDLNSLPKTGIASKYLFIFLLFKQYLLIFLDYKKTFFNNFQFGWLYSKFVVIFLSV